MCTCLHLYTCVLVRDPPDMDACMRLDICVLVQDPPDVCLPSREMTTLYMLVHDPPDVHLPSREVTIIICVGTGSSRHALTFAVFI